MRNLIRVTLLFACIPGMMACSEDHSSTFPVVKSDFIRFVPQGDASGCLETALVSYENREGYRVDLIAAVHLADAGYFEQLQFLFSCYDALLYEMVAPHGVIPRKGEEGGSMLSWFQRAFCRGLDLEFQLDAINYAEDNFVHADLTPGEFIDLWEKKGESLFGMIFKILSAQSKAMEQGVEFELTPAAMLEALLHEDSARRLKFLLAREFKNIEFLLASLDSGKEGEESVLLGERNKAALAVLKRQLRAGKKRLALYYGAGHMPDLELRLQRDLGFERTGQMWLTAWNMP
ncbi:MAG: hypothetical protein ABIK28_24960 [Planctomycetota bacterium]